MRHPAKLSNILEQTRESPQGIRLTKAIIGELQDEKLDQLKKKCETELIKTKIEIEDQYPMNKYTKCSYAKLRDLQLMKTLLPDVPLRELNKTLKEIPHLKYETNIPLGENKNPFMTEENAITPNWERIEKMPPQLIQKQSNKSFPQT